MDPFKKDKYCCFIIKSRQNRRYRWRPVPSPLDLLKNFRSNTIVFYTLFQAKAINLYIRMDWLEEHKSLGQHLSHLIRIGVPITVSELITVTNMPSNAFLRFNVTIPDKSFQELIGWPTGFPVGPLIRSQAGMRIGLALGWRVSYPFNSWLRFFVLETLLTGKLTDHYGLYPGMTKIHLLFNTPAAFIGYRLWESFLSMWTDPSRTLDFYGLVKMFRV